jgi:hypothetical protein
MLMPKKDIYQTPARQRYFMLLAALGVVALLGIVFAGYIDRPPPDIATDQLSNFKPAIITEITVGALARPELAESMNPPIQQRPFYTTADQLVMKVTTAENIVEPIEVNVRLLTTEKRVTELDPPSVKFQPGTSSFCCWRIESPGDYTLQIFRPEKIVSSQDYESICAAARKHTQVAPQTMRSSKMVISNHWVPDQRRRWKTPQRLVAQLILLILLLVIFVFDKA